MAPPARRRRFDTPEEIAATIEALSNMGAPPRLDEPVLDAREALYELAKGRGPDVGRPYTGPLPEAPAERPPVYAEYKRDDNEPEPEPAPSPAAPPAAAATTKPTLDELLKELPPLPQQRPVPPPNPVYTEYRRDDNEPAPAPPPPEPEPDAPMGPPAPEDVIASGRDPFDPRDPIPPVYTPPPEEERPPEQEAGPTPEVVTASPRGASANTEAEHVRAAMRGAAVAPAQAVAPPLPGDAPRDPTLPPGQAPPLRRDYSDTAGRVASTPQQGARPDYFGHDDDPGFTRDARIRQAREAYDRLPERRSQQWEQEYLARNQRMGDQEIRRRGIALGLFGGYDRMREAQNDWRQGQQRYDQGLTAAQARDRGEGRISRAQAEALAATGQVSPEAAAEMRLNDPLLKQFGQFASQGGRAEHLDFQRDKMIQELLARTAQNDARYAADKELQKQKDEAAKEREGIRGATQRGVAETYAKGRAQQQTKKELTPEEHANLMAAELRREYKLSLTVADQAARGNYGNVPDAQKEDVEARVRTMLYHPDTASTRKYGPDVAAIPAKSGEQIKHEASKQRATILLKPAQIKENNEITSLAADVRRAAQSWSQMPQAARDVFVQFGRDAPAALKSKGLGQYQAQAGDLQELVGGVRRRFAGLAQTNSELQGIADQMGMTAETWDPFKGSKAFEHAMERILEQTRLRKRMLNNLSKPQEP